MKERRRAPRFLALFDIQYSTDGIVSIQSKNKSRDISKVGVKLPVYKLISPGTKLRLEIEVPGSARPVIATGKVVWTKSIGADKPGIVDAGLEFMDINTQDLYRMMEVVKRSEPA